MAQYKYGDVVWVLASKRLGWWPARVENVDKLTPDLKKDVTEDTICVAKYLNEDNYQFVEDSNQICKYSSDKKEELISAGMSKHFHMWFYMITLKIMIDIYSMLLCTPLF